MHYMLLGRYNTYQEFFIRRVPSGTALSVSSPRTCGLSTSIAHANSNFFSNISCFSRQYLFAISPVEDAAAIPDAES